MSSDSEIKKDGALRWRRVGDSAVICGLDPDVVDCVIPRTIDDFPVVAIEEAAFKACLSLKSVVFPSGVLRIENHAFYDCSCLERVVLPDGLTTIEGRAFAGCRSLRFVSIPRSVATIGRFAFASTVQLNVISGSYAEQWSKENGVKFTSRSLLSEILCTTPDDPVRIDDKTRLFGGIEYSWYNGEQDFVRRVTVNHVEYTLTLTKDKKTSDGRRRVLSELKTMTAFTPSECASFRESIASNFLKDKDELRNLYYIYKEPLMSDAADKLEECCRQVEQIPDSDLENYFRPLKQDIVDAAKQKTPPSPPVTNKQPSGSTTDPVEKQKALDYQKKVDIVAGLQHRYGYSRKSYNEYLGMDATIEPLRKELEAALYAARALKRRNFKGIDFVIDCPLEEIPKTNQPSDEALRRHLTFKKGSEKLYSEERMIELRREAYQKLLQLYHDCKNAIQGGRIRQLERQIGELERRQKEFRRQFENYEKSVLSEFQNAKLSLDGFDYLRDYEYKPPVPPPPPVNPPPPPPPPPPPKKNPPPPPPPPYVPGIEEAINDVFKKRPDTEYDVRRMLLNLNVPLSEVQSYTNAYLLRYGALLKREPPKSKLPDSINQALETVRQKKPKTQDEVKKHFLKLGYDDSYALTLTSIFMNRWGDQVHKPTIMERIKSAPIVNRFLK